MLHHDSIIATTFTARVVDEVEPGVITEITGMAYPTRESTFALDDGDPLGTGFALDDGDPLGTGFVLR